MSCTKGQQNDILVAAAAAAAAASLLLIDGRWLSLAKRLTHTHRLICDCYTASEMVASLAYGQDDDDDE